MPESVCSAVLLNRRDEILIPPGQFKVFQRRLVHREKAHGRAVLRCHVRDRRACRQRHTDKARPEVLHKLSNDAMLAEYLRNAENKISRRAAFGKFAQKLHADHFRNQHRNWLTQHARFGFNTADAPPKNTEPIDHCRVRVRAHKAVRIQPGFVIPDNLSEILKIDLVHDSGRRWHHAEIVECLLPPLQKLIPLTVASEFMFSIDGDRRRRVERIDLHRMVDDKIARNKRIHRGGRSLRACHLNDG